MLVGIFRSCVISSKRAPLPSMNPYEPTVVANYGAWELVEGLSGRALRRRRRGPAKPHLLMAAVAVGAGIWLNLNGELDDRSSAVFIGFGLLVAFLGTRFSSRSAKELRFGSSELMWAAPGEMTGVRWPIAELSHIEIFEPLKNLPPGMARRTRPRFEVTIQTRAGAPLPISFVLFDAKSAAELARRMADATGLRLRTEAGRPD